MNNDIIEKAKDFSARSWTIHAYTLEPKVDDERFQLGDKWTIYKWMKIFLNVKPCGLCSGAKFKTFTFKKKLKFQLKSN